jgi:hypothetical protein
MQPGIGGEPAWTVTLAEGEVLTLIGHLLSSAELCLYEPELYGSFRLLDATGRLLSILLRQVPADQDAFLRQLKRELDQKKGLMLYDQEGYRAFVREAPVLLARRLKDQDRRAGGGGSDGNQARDGC